MVRACLREKVGLFYIVISYYDEQHKRRQIWIPTKLKTKGNKRKAQSMLDEYKYYYDVEKRQLVYESAVRKANMGRTEILQESKTLAEEPQLSNGVLFGDYIYQWNEDNKTSLQATTYDGYKSQIIRSIQPYFNARGITLLSITADDIRLYYKILIRKVSASTVRRYHSNIRKCLQEAFEDDKIQSNPADKVKLPKGDTFVSDYYNKDELIKLLEVVKGTKLEFPVFIAVYYGLRRSEIAGLKWSAIDFTYKTLSIVHTVVYCNVDGKAAVVAKDRTKTVKSMRTLPLMPVVEEMLLRMKAEQEQNRQFFKKSYEEQGYIYVLADGTPVNPDYITKAFIKFIKNKGLRHIRFHDLRHSCATLMRHEGVRLEDIQKWLGHSQISTTEKFYAHFSDEQHKNSARLISNCLSQKPRE